MFFEGPEKKVELVVGGGPDLRSLGDAFWTSVIHRAGAQPLSRISSDCCEAWLLSESSLFVFAHRVLMITCGTTTLVRAVEAMLDQVDREGLTLIYERKNEHFPERQITHFQDDARALSALVPGRALRFGAPEGHRLMLFHSLAPFAPDPDDVTLEILMHGLGPEATAMFQHGPIRSGARVEANRQARLKALLDGYEIDEHHFTPAGYSLNALKGDRYATIHVTPEQVGSYASFETNLDFRGSPDRLIHEVVELFDPRAFDVITFTPGRAPELAPRGCLLVDHVATSELCGFHVAFRHFARPPGSPRAPDPLPLVETAAESVNLS